jgi:hypothetical protein
MKIVEEALTFDDVLLLPGYSEILPSQANLENSSDSTNPSQYSAHFGCNGYGD